MITDQMNSPGFISNICMLSPGLSYRQPIRGPPSSLDDEQQDDGDNERVQSQRFGQSQTDDEHGTDVAGGFGLPGDGLAVRAGQKTDADARADRRKAHRDAGGETLRLLRASIILSSLIRVCLG